MTTVGRLGYPLHMDTLPNGLRVIVSPDHAAPVVAVNLWYGVGSRDEVAGRTGLAHLFEHVMFQGSAHVPSGDHFNSLQAAGGTCNATTWFDRTNYFASFAANDDTLKWYLDWQADAMVNSFIARKDLDTEMTVVRNEMEMGENSPGSASTGRPSASSTRCACCGRVTRTTTPASTSTWAPRCASRGARF